MLSRAVSSTSLNNTSSVKNRTPPSSPTTAAPLKFRRTDGPADYITSGCDPRLTPNAAFGMYNINNEFRRLGIDLAPTQGASTDKGAALQDGRVARPIPPSSKSSTQIHTDMPPPPTQQPQQSRVLPPAGRVGSPAVALPAEIDMPDSPYVPTKADLHCPPRPQAVVTRSLSKVQGSTPPTSPPHGLSLRTVHDVFSPEFLTIQRDRAAQRRRDGTATPGAPSSPTSPTSPSTTPQGSPTAMDTTPLGSPLQPWTLPSLPTIPKTTRRYSPAPSPMTSPTNTAAAPLQRAVSFTGSPPKQVTFVELEAPDSDMDCESEEDVDMDEPLQRSDTNVSCNGQRALLDTPRHTPHTTCDVCLAHSSPMCSCDYCCQLRDSNANICNVCGRVHYPLAD